MAQNPDLQRNHCNDTEEKDLADVNVEMSTPATDTTMTTEGDQMVQDDEFGDVGQGDTDLIQWYFYLFGSLMGFSHMYICNKR